MEETKANNQKICPKCGKEYPKKAINCDDCKVTLMKRTTYGRINNDFSNMLLICPQCKKRYYPPNTSQICEKCKTELVANDKFMQNEAQKSTNFNTTLTIILIIIVLIVFGYLISIIATPSEPDIYTCARCNKTFTDSANTKSIAYSNFCEKCHDDVEFLKEVQDAME